MKKRPGDTREAIVRGEGTTVVDLIRRTDCHRLHGERAAHGLATAYPVKCPEGPLAERRAAAPRQGELSREALLGAWSERE